MSTKTQQSQKKKKKKERSKQVNKILKKSRQRSESYEPGLAFVVQSLSRVSVCYPMDCSTPGFPVLHHWCYSYVTLTFSAHQTSA